VGTHGYPCLSRGGRTGFRFGEQPASRERIRPGWSSPARCGGRSFPARLGWRSAPSGGARRCGRRSIRIPVRLRWHRRRRCSSSPPWATSIAMDSPVQLNSAMGDLDRDGFVSLLSKLTSESARLQSLPERRGRGSARLQLRHTGSEDGLGNAVVSPQRQSSGFYTHRCEGTRRLSG
jgi:hypothetical protein